MRTRVGSRLVTGLRHDEVARPYIEQLMNAQNCSQAQTYDEQSSNLNNSVGTAAEQNNESGYSGVRKVRGLHYSKMFGIYHRGRQLLCNLIVVIKLLEKRVESSSFLSIVARTPELIPLNVDDWREFDKEEKKKLVEFVRKKFSIPMRGEEFIKKSIGKKWKDYKCDLKTMYVTKDALIKNRPSHVPRDQWTSLMSHCLSDKAKKRSQANRISRAKQKMPHTGGSKNIATLMNEKAIDGIEPTRAEVYILTHTKRKDGRPLDEESSNTIDMMNERLSNGEISNEQHRGDVASEGDVYSQVLGT